MAIFKGIQTSDYKKLSFPSLEHRARGRMETKGLPAGFTTRIIQPGLPYLQQWLKELTC